MSTAIEARNLVKTYGHNVRALQDLSFSVPAGTIFGLLGPNGAGKSTTVKILTTLAVPDSGQGIVAGFDVQRQADQVRHHIGAVGQKHLADENATGRENLTLHAQIHGLRRREVKRRVAEVIDQFDLGDAADRVVKGYSGGMQRRLDIAMGLVHRPNVLFLDEPTTGLDPEVRAYVWREIARLRDEEALTILLTTHYLEEADQLADRLAIVDKGRIIAEGAPEELKSRLGGDAIHVELAEPPQEVHADKILEHVPGVADVLVDGMVLHARAENGGTAVPGVLSALETQAVKVVSITVSRSSLDDVYLQITGQSFS